MHPSEMTTQEIVAELLAEQQGSLSEAEYAILQGENFNQNEEVTQ